MQVPEPTGSGVWLSRFDLEAFNARNADWLERPVDRPEALRRFLGEGVGRLAPLAWGPAFDPVYYREVHPEYGGFSDVDAYRRWLFADLELGWPGSAGEHLERLGLALDRFPETWPWRDYVAALGLVENRWFALQHLVENGWHEAAPVRGDGEWLTVLGCAWRGRDDRSADRAFAAAASAGAESYRLLHEAADVCFRLGDWRGALDLYERAAAGGAAADVWTHVNGARAALRLGGYHRALALLAAGAAHRQRPEWRAAVADAVEARFQARTRRARRLYDRADGRPRADRSIAAAAREAGEAWDRLDPLGAPLEPAPDGPVLILANDDIRACFHYRVEQKAELLARLGRPCRIFRLAEWPTFVEALAEASAVIVYRLPAWPSVLRAMAAARRCGLTVWYDVDDRVFDAAAFPDPLATYGGLLPEADYEAILFGTPLFLEAIRAADYALAPTQVLADALAREVRGGRAFVLPNGLDSRNAPFLALPERRRPSDGSVRLVYASGTKAHNADWEELAGPAVAALMDARPEVSLTIIGHLSLSPEFDRFGDRVRRLAPIDDLSRFWDTLADVDVNLAVLKPGPATDAKSGIKWLEAAVLGLPSVVSATAEYRGLVEHGQDGLLAEDVETWRAQLERLVADPGLRARMGRAARAKALARYGPEVMAEALRTALAYPEAPATARRRPVVLQVETWAGPLGATLEAAGRAGSQQLANGFQLFRVMIHPEADGCDRLEQQRGVAVFRLGGNRNLRARLGALLDRLRPDLVHVRTFDAAGAAAAEAATARRTPYLLDPAPDDWNGEGLDDGPARLEAVRRGAAGTLEAISAPPAAPHGALVVLRGRVAVERLRAAWPLAGRSAPPACVVDLERPPGDEQTVAWGRASVPLLGPVTPDRWLALLSAAGEAIVVTPELAVAAGLVRLGAETGRPVLQAPFAVQGSARALAD